MLNSIKRIENVIDYIEENITEEINIEALACKMCLSVYEFRRVFAFVVGCPISEYIRKRKLSLAAIEIMSDRKKSIQKISEKYGYANQSAFSRAFYELHGIPPTNCINSQADICLFTRPKFDFNITGGEKIAFRIIDDNEFYISGYSGVSTLSDTCCCENIWNEFYEQKIDQTLNTDKLYAAYSNIGNSVECHIGQKSNNGYKINKSRWACFKVYTVDDCAVNEFYQKILFEWLPSSNCKRNENLPTIEVYPFDMSIDGFEWEIRIPIE